MFYVHIFIVQYILKTPFKLDLFMLIAVQYCNTVQWSVERIIIDEFVDCDT